MINAGWRLGLGLFASLFLAGVSASIAVIDSVAITGLLNHGQRAAGRVVAVDRGARGRKTAVLQFSLSDGRTVTTGDRLQMYLVRHRVGDRVTVLYDPADVKVATVDLGRWLWQGPAILFGGAIFFLAIGGVLCWDRTGRRG